MDKIKLIDLFGSGVNLANAMGVSKQYVGQMPDKIEGQKQKARIIGAAVLAGIDITQHQDVFGEIPEQAA